jgi:putative endonuclease
VARQRAERWGRIAEWLCRCHLRLCGWRIVTHDWRCPAGQIDIVARRLNVLAVIEVKSRNDLGTAVMSLAPRQRQRITRAAEAFLSTRPDLAELAVRFDIMLVTGLRPPNHLTDAWRIGD